jgi:uncharacterized RDD family membrane protein YckC
MSVITINTPFNIDLEFEAASVVKRALAWGIDLVILILYRLAFNFAIYDSLPNDDTIRTLAMMFGLALPWLLYHFLMEVFFHGQSIGKKLIGIRVVNIMGNEASISQYLIRLLFRSYFLVPLVASVVISIIFDVTTSRWEIMLGVAMLVLMGAVIGMFMYYVLNKRGQRLGDTLANTLVIEDKAKADIHKTIYLEIADLSYQLRYPEVMRLTDRDINGIRNLLDVKRITKEHEAYMERISSRITEVLGISSQQDPYDFLAQLLRDYNYLTSRK